MKDNEIAKHTKLTKETKVFWLFSGFCVFR